MRNTPKTRIGPTTINAFTSITSVLLLLAVLLFTVVTVDGHTGTGTGAIAAAADRQPLPTLAPDLEPPAVAGEASQQPLPTLAPDLTPTANAAPPVTQPSPQIISSEPPSMTDSPTPSPMPSASDEGLVASPTPELAQASDPSPGPMIFPPGSITLRLWTCRPGYNPFASGANLIADCVTPSDREIFSLTALGEIGTSGTREDRTFMGIVTFDDLGPGTYTLSHSPPFLTAYSIPLGCTPQTPTATATPPANALALTVSLVSISLPLARDQAIVCDWYNVPLRRSAFPPEFDPSIGPVEREP